MTLIPFKLKLQNTEKSETPLTPSPHYLDYNTGRYISMREIKRLHTPTEHPPDLYNHHLIIIKWPKAI